MSQSRVHSAGHGVLHAAAMLIPSLPAGGAQLGLCASRYAEPGYAPKPRFPSLSLVLHRAQMTSTPGVRGSDVGAPYGGDRLVAVAAQMVGTRVREGTRFLWVKPLKAARPAAAGTGIPWLRHHWWLT